MRIIRVCTPHYNGFEAAKAGLNSLTGDVRFEVVQRQGTIISHVRNSMLTDNSCTLKKQPVLDRDFLFIDSDIIFKKEDVERIIKLGESHPIVFFPYKTQKDPALYQCGFWGPILGTVGARANMSYTVPQIIHWCGAGFLFIKKEVFEKIEYPYFRFYVLDIGNHAIQVGEDFGFAIQVWNKIPIFCDFSNPVEHVLRRKN